MREKGGIWFYALGIEWIMKSGLHIEVVSDASKKQKLFQNLESSFLRQIYFFSLESYAQMKHSMTKHKYILISC